MPHDELVRRIIEIDEEKLNEEIVASLLKNLPEAAAITKLQEKKDLYDDMQESEKFCVKVRPKKKKVFDWRNPTDPRYPADPRYFY